MSGVWSADIGYITDLHLTNRNNFKWFAGPSFLACQLERLDYFVDLANQNGCQGILMGGDLFDDWDDFSMSMFCDFTDILEKFKGEWIRSVIGNHDILHSNPDTVRRSGVGALKLWRPDIFELYEDENYRVHPIHWWHPFTKKLLKQKTFKFKEYPKTDILALHAQVGPYSTPHCIGIEELTIWGPDFVFFGDQHLGWKPRRANNTWYINPGAFSNMTSDDLKRVPRCSFIRGNEVKEFPLPRTPVAVQEAKKQLNRLTEHVAMIKQQDDIDFLKAIELVSKEKKYDNEVRDWLVSKVLNRRSGT